MFDDFEDPFAIPMEELKLAPAPSPAAAKKRTRPYTDDEVRNLAAFGEGGDVVKNASYAMRTRRRLRVLRRELKRHQEQLDAALKVRDEEFLLLASKLPVKDEHIPCTEGRERKRTMDALHTGEVGAILAAPSLEASSRARAASRDAALHAAALNKVDDGPYRRGAEVIALLTSLAFVALALLLLL